MSLAPPDLPSPAPTPDGHPPPLLMTPAAGPVDPSDAAQSRLRGEIETQLLRLSQDLYEMEVCAGEVGKDMEGAVPQYL
jgi:mediator of RNA polymerase II transcription subunit 10